MHKMRNNSINFYSQTVLFSNSLQIQLTKIYKTTNPKFPHVNKAIKSPTNVDI